MKKLLQILLIFSIFVLNADEFRIVSLSPAMTEIICHLGLEKKLIARSEVCNYPQSVLTLPVAGGFAKPNVEKIIELKPTHIVTNDLINPNVISVFKNRNIDVINMQCNNLQDYRKCVEKISEVFGIEEVGNKEIAKLAEFEKHPYKPLNIKVLWVVFDNPIMVAGANSILDEVSTLAGVENIAGKVNQPYFKSSLDWIIEENPDVIIWAASPGGWKKKIWQKIPAVKRGNLLYDYDQDIILRCSPRIFEGIIELREKLEKLK